jgi:hypothetical protein
VASLVGRRVRLLKMEGTRIGFQGLELYFDGGMLNVVCKNVEKRCIN